MHPLIAAFIEAATRLAMSLPADKRSQFLGDVDDALGIPVAIHHPERCKQMLQVEKGPIEIVPVKLTSDGGDA